eukprot:5916922-Pyramimonas_sp.AAC.1
MRGGKGKEGCTDQADENPSRLSRRQTREVARGRRSALALFVRLPHPQMIQTMSVVSYLES